MRRPRSRHWTGPPRSCRCARGSRRNRPTTTNATALRRCAALEVATGLVTDRCFQQHTNVEFLAFLKRVTRAYPRVPPYVVCDNYATHKHSNVTARLAKHPRVQLHFTPTSGSWLNMVEIFFKIITRQAIRRDTFHSVKDLERAIGTYIVEWKNERAPPFTWTKNANEIIAHAKPLPHCKKTYKPRHKPRRFSRLVVYR